MRKFFIASTVLVLGCVGLMAIALKPAIDHNPMRSVGNSIAFGLTMPAKIVGGTLAAPTWPVSNRQAKRDREYDEAAGDIADAEQATFSTRYAGLEK